MANTTYTRTKTVTLWNEDGWTNITFDAITPAAGESFVRWKIESGAGGQVEQRDVSYTPFSRSTWYTDKSRIDCASNFNAPRFQSRYTYTGGHVNVTFTLTVEFEETSHTVTVNAGTGGSASANVSTAASGATVTVTCTPNTGYSANTPTASGITFTSAGTNKWSFTMPSTNVSISCTFSKISYNVSKTQGTGGTGTLSKTSANYGDTITVTASPSAGYTANTPTATGITFTSAGTNKWTFTMPAGAVTVAFTFTAITYTITKVVSPSGAGTITTGANSGTVGQQITVSQTPAAGYYFNGWTISPSSVTVSSGKITMPASNVTITANYLKRSTCSLSSSSMTGNGTVTLNIMADKTTYSHKYKLSFGTNMETSLTTVAAGTSSVTISVPDSWSNYIPSATSKSGGTLLLETYNGSTKIGEYTISSLTYNVRSNAVPTIGTITTSIIRTVGGTTYANVGNYYVQNKSAVRIQTTGSGVLSSTITKMETSISGYTADAYKNTVNSASVDFTSGLLTVSGTATITVKVTDSRGRTATKTATITVTAYNSPNGSLTVQRVDSSRNVDPAGTYAVYSLTKSYTAVGSNSLAWSITSQNSTASNPAASGDLLPNSRQSFSQTTEYTIRLTLQDSFETVHIDVKLPTARFFIYCNAAGDRIGFMTATNESLSKNGKDVVIQFPDNAQIYIGNTTLEAYIAAHS